MMDDPSYSYYSPSFSTCSSPFFRSEKIVAGYRIGEVLGVGTYGEVRTAVCIETNELVAVKLIDLSRFSYETSVLIKKEISILRSLDHENVVKILSIKENIPYAGDFCSLCACTECKRIVGSSVCSSCSHDFIEHSNQKIERKLLLLIQQLCVGGELFGLLIHSGPFEDRLARYYYRQLIEGLEHCHNRGVVHRDLKPENLVLDERFNLKIVDFGLAASMQPGESGEITERVLHSGVGSLPYSSPETYFQRELYHGRGYDGPMADLWSSAVVLFVMLTGRPPFLRPIDRNYSDSIKKDRHFCALLRGEGYSGISSAGKDFLSKLFKMNPAERLTIAQIKEEPWYKLPVPSPEELSSLMEEKSKKVWLSMEKSSMIDLLNKMRAEQVSAMLVSSPPLSPMQSPTNYSNVMSALATPPRFGTPLSNFSLESPIRPFNSTPTPSPPPIALSNAASSSSIGGNNSSEISMNSFSLSNNNPTLAGKADNIMSPVFAAVGLSSSPPFNDADIHRSMITENNPEPAVYRRMQLSRTPSPLPLIRERAAEKISTQESRSPIRGKSSNNNNYNNNNNNNNHLLQVSSMKLPTSFSSPQLNKSLYDNDNNNDHDDDDGEGEEGEQAGGLLFAADSDDEQLVDDNNRHNNNNNNNNNDDLDDHPSIADDDNNEELGIRKSIPVPVRRSSPQPILNSSSSPPRPRHTASSVLSKLPPPLIRSGSGLGITITPLSMSAPSSQPPIALFSNNKNINNNDHKSRTPSRSADDGSRRSSFSSVIPTLHLERTSSRDKLFNTGLGGGNEIQSYNLFQLKNLPIPIASYTRCTTNLPMIDAINTINHTLDSLSLIHAAAPLPPSSSLLSMNGMAIELAGNYEGFPLAATIYLLKTAGSNNNNSNNKEIIIDCHRRRGDILIFGSLFRLLSAALVNQS